MQKLLLLLITLTTFTNVSYASFPVNNQIKTDVLELSESDSESLNDPFELTGLAIAILIFYLFRASSKTTDPNERKRLGTYAIILSIILVILFISVLFLFQSISTSWINFFDRNFS